MKANEPGNQAKPGDRAKVCERCGASFDCGAKTGDCWCMELPAFLPLPADTTRDCLCPDCLQAALQEKTKIPDVS